jgi:hypothetical protein
VLEVLVSSCIKDWVEVIKGAVETLAVLIGGYFVLQRVLAGNRIVNLSLKIVCDRVVGPSGKDLLRAVLSIEKGDRSTVQIHDIEVRINGQPTPWRSIWRDQVLRFTSVEQKHLNPPHLKITWGAPATEAHFLNLSPGEKTELANYCEVDRGVVCQVDVVVLGVELKSCHRSQWKASAVSLPV